MSKTQSPQKQNTLQGTTHDYKKIIHNYTISYCKKQFLGRSLYGQVRLGYETNEKRVRAFRINSLPMSEQAKANLELQKYYSQLGQCARLIYENIQTQSNRYTVMEYFPKTFKTQLAYFRKLTKNMEPYIEKFLQMYAKLYYYRIVHGNITLDNIGITFDGKVKLMDFRSVDQLTFQEGANKDYRDFRNMMCFILERDKTFPNKFEVLDDPKGNWIKLFSVWHVVNIYQYVYREKKQPYQNITVLLSKLQSSLCPEDEQETNQNYENVCVVTNENMIGLLRLGLRLLMLSVMKRVGKKEKKVHRQIIQLQKILQPLDQHNISFYNSLLWGAVTDPEYYKIHQMQRLTLIVCLLPALNHQYFYMEILKQFEPNREEAEKFCLFADNLLHGYASIMKDNLIQL